MKKLLVLFVSGLMLSSSYGAVEMRPKTVLFVPDSLTISPISPQVFAKNASAFYLSIDDFLDKSEKEKNEQAFSSFLDQCTDLIKYYDYKNELKKILRSFNKFATETAPCEVDGFYGESDVDSYCDFLIARLRQLNEFIKE